MYKLLLVDDESGQLTALEYILNQLRPEYEIHTATDGQEALEVLATNTIDIMFTDIRMPIIDGLQLVEKLFERGIQIKIVIISGYDEFEYAQKAIRFGVNDYLVKPVSKSDLQNVLCKIENILKEERNVKVQVEELKKKLDDSLPVYLEDILNKWVYGQIRSEEKNEIASIIPYKEFGLILITSFYKTHGSEEIINSEFIQYVKFSMKESLSFLGHSISFFSESDKQQMITVLASNNPINYKSYDARMKMEQFIEKIRNKFNIKTTIGIGKITENIIECAEEAFNSAITALENRFFFGLEKVIYHSDEYNTISLTNKINILESEIKEALRYGDKSLIPKITNRFFEEIKNKYYKYDTSNQLKENLAQLLLFITKSISNQIDNEDYTNLTEEIRRKPFQFEEYSELRQFINETLYRIIDFTHKKFKDKNVILINKCKKFINEKYMEDLSLEMIAQKYFFNPSYFSNLFKRYNGISFSEYLVKVRIQNAVRLLESSEESMSDIAMKVGFKNSAHFIRIFKRETGLPPNKYRQINRSNRRED